MADLCRSAARVREAGLESAGRRGRLDGYRSAISRMVFIPVTQLCRGLVQITATSVTGPGQATRSGHGRGCTGPERFSKSPVAVLNLVKEALFTASAIGRDQLAGGREWCRKRGYDSTLVFCGADGDG